MVRIVASSWQNAGGLISFVYILQTTWMSNEKLVENPNLRKKKKHSMLMLLLLLLLSKERKKMVLHQCFCLFLWGSLFSYARETVWYISMYYLWTAFCSLPQSWIETVLYTWKSNNLLPSTSCCYRCPIFWNFVFPTTNLLTQNRYDTKFWESGRGKRIRLIQSDLLSMTNTIIRHKATISNGF